MSFLTVANGSYQPLGFTDTYVNTLRYGGAMDCIEHPSGIKFCRDLWTASTEAYKMIKKTPKKTIVVIVVYMF